MSGSPQEQYAVLSPTAQRQQAQMQMANPLMAQQSPQAWAQDHPMEIASQRYRVQTGMQDPLRVAQAAQSTAEGQQMVAYLKALNAGDIATAERLSKAIMAGKIAGHDQGQAQLTRMVPASPVLPPSAFMPQLPMAMTNPSQAQINGLLASIGRRQ